MVGGEAVVDFFGVGAAVDAGGEHEELGVVTLFGAAEAEGIFAGAGVVGVEFFLSFYGGGGAEESGEGFGFFAEVEGVAVAVPVGVSGAEAGGPFEGEVTVEDSFDFEREFGFDIEGDEGAGLVDWNEKRFADGESVAGVDDGGGFGAHGDGACQSVGVEDAFTGVEAEMQIAKDF